MSKIRKKKGLIQAGNIGGKYNQNLNPEASGWDKS